MFSLLFSFPRAVDFYIGALLSINASPFLLTGADDKAHIQLQMIRDNRSTHSTPPHVQALCYMEEHPDQFAVANAAGWQDFPVVLRETWPRCEVQLALQKIQSLTSWLQKRDGMISGLDLRKKHGMMYQGAGGCDSGISGAFGKWFILMYFDVCIDLCGMFFRCHIAAGGRGRLRVLVLKWSCTANCSCHDLCGSFSKSTLPGG